MRGLKVLLTVFLSTLLLLIFSKEVFAQVVINEFVADGSPEWVEFKNSSGSAEYLKEYWLDDDTNFGDDNGSSLIKKLSDLNVSSVTYPYFNITGSFLNNSGDSVVLFNSSGLLVDQTQFSSSQGPGVAIGRNPDGADGFVFMQSSTKGAANSGPQATSTTLPSNTPTAFPSLTPIATSVDTKSPTPKPTKTPSPTPDYTPGTSGAGDSGSEDTVLGIRDELATATPEGGETGDGKPFPVVAGVIMGLGGLSVIGSGVWFFKIRKGTYNGVSEENPPTVS